jgi:hypothetical protein
VRHSRLQHQVTLSGEEHAVRCPRVSAGRRRRAPLSRPTSPRTTPITTTGLAFMVRLDTDGELEVAL